MGTNDREFRMRKLFWLEHKVYEWLNENLPDHKYEIEHVHKNQYGEFLRIEYCDVIIRFDYGKDAMQFKLVWG